MWPYPWTHVGTPSHLGHMDLVAATMPSQAHAGAAQEAPDIGQWEGQDVFLVRPSSCNVKGGIPSSRRYLPTYHCFVSGWSLRYRSMRVGVVVGLVGQQHADVCTKCALIKKSCKKKFLQRHVKTAIPKSSDWGDLLKRLEQMYQVYETDLSVFTEIEELPPLPEFPTAARIFEFVAQLEELMGRTNRSFYGPTEPHLWLAGKIPMRTWDDCRETSERKARTNCYNDMVDLLIELAMEREKDSHMDKYLRKHLRRETPAEKSPGGRSPRPHFNPGKGRWGAVEAHD